MTKDELIKILEVDRDLALGVYDWLMEPVVIDAKVPRYNDTTTNYSSEVMSRYKALMRVRYQGSNWHSVEVIDA